MKSASKHVPAALYAILEKFWEGWQQVEIEDSREAYLKLLKALEAGLLEWKRNNNIIDEVPIKIQ